MITCTNNRLKHWKVKSFVFKIN